jgi:predicted transcriptional regulator
MPDPIIEDPEATLSKVEEPIGSESNVTESKVEELKVESQTPEPTPTPEPIPEPAPQQPTPEPTPEPPIATESKVEESKVESRTEPEKAPEPTPAPPPPPIKDEPGATESKATELKVEESKVESQTKPIATPLPRSSSAELTTGDPVVETPPPVAPALHDPKYTRDIPQKVLELTAEEINAARLLWGREHIAAAQAQGNRNRRARMNGRMDAIEKLIKTEHMSTTHAIAGGVRLSEKLTSSYLQKLVHAGRIKATGNSSNRRYSA